MHLSGHAAMVAVVDLLQRIRLADPEYGIWEAADACWWWRMPRASDALPTIVIEEGGQPAAALTSTAWRDDRWQVDLISMPDRRDLRAGLWQHIEEVLPEGVAVEAMIQTGDEQLQELAAEAGFEGPGDAGSSLWMRADERQSPTDVPDGYRLVDRTQDQREPHHLVRRGHSSVAARLAETPLYRPDLDLFVVAPDDTVAGYGLFWFDPVTSVGMVEPMRTEEGHMNRGLGRAVLTEGLERMAHLGASRLKIGVDLDNDNAKYLYTSAGFHLTAVDHVWTRPA